MTGPAPHARAPAQSLEAGGAVRILVVDDDLHVRELLAEFLAASGFRVDTAEDGRTALDHLGRVSYDLVLSDVLMPGLDGIAVTEWIRETHPDLPVIAMSGKAAADVRTKALQLGVADYLTKPLPLQEVHRTIELSLAKRHGQRELESSSRVTKKLREIERIKDELIAAVSHEFRTPLTIMRGFLSLLWQRGTDNLYPDQLEAIQTIGVSIDRLQMLVDNLLTLRDCQNDTCGLLLERTRIDSFFNEYLHFARGSGRRVDFELELERGVERISIAIDRIRFPLVLANLVDNALKFGRDGGPARALIQVRREGEEIVLEVHDDGIGIDESLRERIFERFTQADATATRPYCGAGLGLAVVREVVRAHGGTVRLVAPVLGGTSVRVALPSSSEE